MSVPRDRLGRRLPPGSPDGRRYGGDPERAASSFEGVLAQALALYGDGDFFEAHEFFEYLWKHPDAAPSERDLWKGLAQVAVGCCHVQRGNPTGAVALWERAAVTLGPYPEEHRGLGLGTVRDEARAAAAALRAGEPPERILLPRLAPALR